MIFIMFIIQYYILLMPYISIRLVFLLFELVQYRMVYVKILYFLF